MNGGDWGKLIVARGFKSCPKCNKLPNLVTLVYTYLRDEVQGLLLLILLKISLQFKF